MRVKLREKLLNQRLGQVESLQGLLPLEEFVELVKSQFWLAFSSVFKAFIG